MATASPKAQKKNDIYFLPAGKFSSVVAIAYVPSVNQWFFNTDFSFLSATISLHSTGSYRSCLRVCMLLSLSAVVQAISLKIYCV